MLGLLAFPILGGLDSLHNNCAPWSMPWLQASFQARLGMTAIRRGMYGITIFRI
jgi:hypothetical protein